MIRTLSVEEGAKMLKRQFLLRSNAADCSLPGCAFRSKVDVDRRALQAPQLRRSNCDSYPVNHDKTYIADF